MVIAGCRGRRLSRAVDDGAESETPTGRDLRDDLSIGGWALPVGGEIADMEIC